MLKRVFISIIILLFLTITPVYADSGWDSYSDYSPSIDYDYDFDYDYGSNDYGRDIRLPDTNSKHSSSNHSSSSSKNYLTYVIILLVTILSAASSKKIKFSDKTSRDIKTHEDEIKDAIMNNNHTLKEDNIPDNYDHVISKYLENYTEQKLLDDFYEIFVMIQKAWMNFEYEVLEEYCSNELYKEYVTDLEELKKEHCKNIMNKFELKNSTIRNIEKIKNRIVIDAYLEVSFYDYVINEETKNVVFGNKKEKVDNNYDLEFIIDLDDVEKCPNCGAPVTGRKCEFCKTVMEKKNTSLVLNKKSLMRK